MPPVLKAIPVEELILDDQNPRLPGHLKGADEPQIIDYMLMEAATLDLMLAIGQNGYFAGEPLLVVKDGKTYRVVEGNRRLTALKLLKDPTLASVKERKVHQVHDAVGYKGDLVRDVPCQIFDSEAPIHKYLGYRHITGVQSWDLTQKAAFLTGMREQSFGNENVDDASRELAKMIGSRRDYVKRLLVGYELFELIRDSGFFKIDGLSETSFYFNYIADSLSRPNIAAYLGIDLQAQEPTSSLNEAALEEWTHWFFEKNAENKTRIKATAEELRMLNAVLTNDQALKAFREDGKKLSDAFELTAEMEDVFINCIATALDSLETADSMTHKLNSYYGSLDDDLRSITRLARKIKSARDAAEDADDD